MAAVTTYDEVLGVFYNHPDWTSVQIARRLGCCSSYVRATLTRHGLKLKKRGGRALQDWEYQAIADARRDGEKLEALAAEFGLSLSAISRVAKREGVPRSGRGRPPKRT